MTRRTRALPRWALLAVTFGLTLATVATLPFLAMWSGPDGLTVGVGSGSFYLGHVPARPRGGHFFMLDASPGSWFVLERHASAVGWEVYVPLWAMIVPMTMWTVLAFSGARMRPSPGRCPKCGYDRAGLEAGAACPECGRMLLQTER